MHRDDANHAHLEDHTTQQEILGQQVASFLEGEKDDKNVVVWASGY